MKKNAILTLICLVFLFSVSAQNNMQITWQACFGGSGTDWIFDIIETDDGGYFLLGTTASQNGDITNNHGEWDIWLVKTDSVGNLLWQRCYGGSDIDYSTNIIKDNQGNYYFGGDVSSDDGDVQSGNHGIYDRWIVKIDSEGEIIWEQCYGGSNDDYGGTLMWLSDGNILVYGAAHSGDGDVPINYGFLDIWLMKINPEGEILESHVYGNQLHNNVFSVIETSDGGYFFAGKAGCIGGMVQGDYKGDVDVWVVKLNSQFEIEWQQLYGGTYQDYGYRGAIELEDGYIFTAITNSNDFDVSGFHGTPGLYESDIWAVKIDFTGNIVWQKCLGGNDYDWAGTLHLANDDGFYIIGETQSNNGDVSGNHSYPNWGWSDIWIVKLSSEGELEWQKCYGGLGDERIYNGAIKKSDNHWILGGRASYNSDDVNCSLYGEYNEDFWVFELDTVDTTWVIEYHNENDMVTVKPNPAGEWTSFNYKLPVNSSEGLIEITDVSGAVIERITVTGTEGQKVWDTRKIKSGVYFYMLNVSGNSKSGKIVICK
jgi:hypothetical protein